MPTILDWSPVPFVETFGPVAGPILAALWLVLYPVFVIYAAILEAGLAHVLTQAVVEGVANAGGQVAAKVGEAATSAAWACTGVVALLIAAFVLLLTLMALRDDGAGAD